MAYTYTKHTWEDKPSSNTPITAEKLTEIEEGIYQANENKVDKEDGKGLSTNDFTTDLLTKLNSADANSHTHSNKSVLDGITNVKVNNWDKVSDKVDKVSGKGLSTNDLTDTLKSSYDSAVTNSHTHSNKSVLDTVTKSVVDNSHTHDNKEVLDKISVSNDGDFLYDGNVIQGGGSSSGGAVIDDSTATTNSTYSSSKIESLVSGISGGGDASIDDEESSTTTTYSSDKINSLLDTKVDKEEGKGLSEINVTQTMVDKWNSGTDSGGGGGTLNKEVVEELPTDDIDDNTIYFVESDEENTHISEIDDTASSLYTTYSSNKIDKLLGTTLTSTLSNGSISLTLSDDSITTTSSIDIYTDTWSAYPTDVSVSNGTITLTFDSQDSDVNVKVVVK